MAETQTKALSKRKQKKELMFTGAQQLMTKPASIKEKGERDLQITVARLLGVSPFGVNILGNNPYVNNSGRREKLDEYHGLDKWSFEYNWIQRSVNDTDKAICEVRIRDKEGKVLKRGKGEMPWIVGECSPASMHMGTLKGYQNHMAQTRAENRAFQYVYGQKVMRELMERIITELNQGTISHRTAAQAAEAARVSAEEVGSGSGSNYGGARTATTVPELPAKTEASDPFTLAKNYILGRKTVKDLDAAEERLKDSPDFTQEQKTKLFTHIKIKRGEVNMAARGGR